MTNGRPRWTFGPAPSGRQPPETGGQWRLLQRNLVPEAYKFQHMGCPIRCTWLGFGLRIAMLSHNPIDVLVTVFCFLAHRGKFFLPWKNWNDSPWIRSDFQSTGCNLILDCRKVCTKSTEYVWFDNTDTSCLHRSTNFIGQSSISSIYTYFMFYCKIINFVGSFLQIGKIWNRLNPKEHQRSG